MPKFEILTVLWLYSHIFAQIKVKFGTGKRACSSVPIFTFIGATCRPFVFGPLSNNNTGMAALCAGLPAIILKRTCYGAAYMSQTHDNSALQSRKWQLIGMRQWCRSALCGHPLPALTNHWIHGAASRHTIAPISHTRLSPRSRSYYSFPVPLRVGG